MGSETWTAVEQYFEGELNGSDAILEAALGASAAAGLPDIQISASQGRLLHLLALTLSSRRILEVGTLGGYSGLWLARALPPQGRLVTLEIDPHHAAVAQRNFVAGGVADRIDLLVGPALESLARLRAQRGTPFDLVFIDADKQNNLAYVQAALALARPGTLIVVDNVVRDAAVIGRNPDAATTGVRRMTEWVGREPLLDATVIQTVGHKGYDGFLVARVAG